MYSVVAQFPNKTKAGRHREGHVIAGKEDPDAGVKQNTKGFNSKKKCKQSLESKWLGRTKIQSVSLSESRGRNPFRSGKVLCATETVPILGNTTYAPQQEPQGV